MSVQIIKQNGNPEWAVIPYEVYLRLVEQAEMLEDVQDFDKYKADLANGAVETIPSEVLYAIMDGTNPIRAFRELRGMTQEVMAKSADITVPYLSQLESGKRKGSLEVMVRVAKALDVDLEMLV
jgi:DNA-binding XRE family transcriptional regulator